MKLTAEVVGRTALAGDAIAARVIDGIGGDGDGAAIVPAVLVGHVGILGAASVVLWEPGRKKSQAEVAFVARVSSTFTSERAESSPLPGRDKGCAPGRDQQLVIQRARPVVASEHAIFTGSMSVTRAPGRNPSGTAQRKTFTSPYC